MSETSSDPSLIIQSEDLEDDQVKHQYLVSKSPGFFFGFFGQTEIWTALKSQTCNFECYYCFDWLMNFKTEQR